MSVSGNEGGGGGGGEGGDGGNSPPNDKGHQNTTITQVADRAKRSLPKTEALLNATRMTHSQRRALLTEFRLGDLSDDELVAVLGDERGRNQDSCRMRVQDASCSALV
jgi:hypothetical protein